MKGRSKAEKRLKIEEMQRLRARLNTPEFDHLTKWSAGWVIMIILTVLIGIGWLWDIGYFG